MPGPTQRFDQFGRKMQAGGRRGDRSLELRIDCLVAAVVQFLAFAAQIGRNRNPPERFEQLPERQVDIPAEPDDLFLLPGGYLFGAQAAGTCAQFEIDMQRAVLPLFQVTDDARPLGTFFGGERPLVIGRIMRFEAEYFDPGSGFLIENEPRPDYFRIVEHQQAAFGQVFPHFEKTVFRNPSVAAEQQFRLLAAFQRKFGDPLLGQRIIVIGYTDILFHAQLTGEPDFPAKEIKNERFRAISDRRIPFFRTFGIRKITKRTSR